MNVDIELLKAQFVQDAMDLESEHSEDWCNGFRQGYNLLSRFQSEMNKIMEEEHGQRGMGNSEGGGTGR